MQPCEMLHLRMMMLHKPAVVRNLPNTYGDRERQQLMSSPIGSHLFDAQGIRAKAGRAIGFQHLAPVVPPSVPPHPAPKEFSMAALGAIGDLARYTAEVPLQVGACLQQHWQKWENIRACEWVVRNPQ
ncbi:hypothetical protein E2C01_092616 [Portunus trituberculatus]|uniref:Uncharacterized protein n=1 Tax=Portunus trituberculatus TaxID=210409 RepID=A0A5B7JSM9_PORTR|nr:hypothetical protein [Portunus trituberculatus]